MSYNDSGVKATPAVRQVDGVTADLEGQTELLMKAMSELENRLSPVLRQPTPEADGKGPLGSPSVLVPHAERLNVVLSHLRTTYQHLESILNRLEL